MKIRLERIECDAEKIIAERGLGSRGKVQEFIDSEVLRKCAPYVPWDNGDLNESGTLNTSIGSGLVIYDTPYARRWYDMSLPSFRELQGAAITGLTVCSMKAVESRS